MDGMKRYHEGEVRKGKSKRQRVGPKVHAKQQSPDDTTAATRSLSNGAAGGRPSPPVDLDDISDLPHSWREALEEAFSWTRGHAAAPGFRPFRVALCSNKLKKLPRLEPSDEEVDVDRVYVCSPDGFIRNAKNDIVPLKALRDSVLKHIRSQDESKTGLRSSSRLFGPLPPEHHEDNTRKVLLRFSDPDPEDDIHAVDVKGVTDDIILSPPSKILAKLHFNETQLRISSANGTPKYVWVDLHNDYSDNLFTVCDAPKLWLLYRPTPSNLAKLYADLREERSWRLAHLHDSLEDGYWAVVFSGEAVYVPPGWLHATYALESGVINGIAWSSAEGVVMGSHITPYEIQARLMTMQHELGPLLRSLGAAVDCGHYEAVCEALQNLCKERVGTGLGELKRMSGRKDEVNQLLREIRDKKKWDKTYMDRRCVEEKCGKLLLDHLPRPGEGAPQSAPQSKPEPKLQAEPKKQKSQKPRPQPSRPRSLRVQNQQDVAREGA